MLFELKNITYKDATIKDKELTTEVFLDVIVCDIFDGKKICLKDSFPMNFFIKTKNFNLNELECSSCKTMDKISIKVSIALNVLNKDNEITEMFKQYLNNEQ